MLTIQSGFGYTRNLSDEVYRIKHWPKHPVTGRPDFPPSYAAGTLVRLISGIDKSNTPGYHFEKGMRTVCRVDATQSEFVGVKLSQLKHEQGMEKILCLFWPNDYYIEHTCDAAYFLGKDAVIQLWNSIGFRDR